MKCEICGSAEGLLFHHYEEHYGSPGLMNICRRCHTRIHRLGKKLDGSIKTVLVPNEYGRMCLKTVRKIVRVGGSHAITLPSYVIKGDKVSVAAEGRLIIMDPRGEISEDDLLDFLESNIEPIFWE